LPLASDALIADQRIEVAPNGFREDLSLEEIGALGDTQHISRCRDDKYEGMKWADITRSPYKWVTGLDVNIYVNPAPGSTATMCGGNSWRYSDTNDGVGYTCMGQHPGQWTSHY
jgi:hypothetical protein